MDINKAVEMVERQKQKELADKKMKQDLFNIQEEIERLNIINRDVKIEKYREDNMHAYNLEELQLMIVYWGKLIAKAQDRIKELEKQNQI